jgi:hypothetical protein
MPIAPALAAACPSFNAFTIVEAEQRVYRLQPPDSGDPDISEGPILLKKSFAVVGRSKRVNALFDPKRKAVPVTAAFRWGTRPQSILRTGRYLPERASRTVGDRDLADRARSAPR